MPKRPGSPIVRKRHLGPPKPHRPKRVATRITHAPKPQKPRR